jgi:hypothetical protein
VARAASGDLVFQGEDVGAGYILHVHVVAALLTAAIDPRGFALIQVAAEDRDDTGLAVGFWRGS